MKRTIVAAICVFTCLVALAPSSQSRTAHSKQRRSVPKISLEKAWSATVHAISDGDLVKVRRMLHSNPKLTSLNSVGGQTLLHIAASLDKINSSWIAVPAQTVIPVQLVET